MDGGSRECFVCYPPTFFRPRCVARIRSPPVGEARDTSRRNWPVAASRTTRGHRRPGAAGAFAVSTWGGACGSSEATEFISSGLFAATLRAPLGESATEASVLGEKPSGRRARSPPCASTRWRRRSTSRCRRSCAWCTATTGDVCASTTRLAGTARTRLCRRGTSPRTDRARSTASWVRGRPDFPSRWRFRRRRASARYDSTRQETKSKKRFVAFAAHAFEPVVRGEANPRGGRRHRELGVERGRRQVVGRQPDDSAGGRITYASIRTDERGVSMYGASPERTAMAARITVNAAGAWALQPVVERVMEHRAVAGFREWVVWTDEFVEKTSLTLGASGFAATLPSLSALGLGSLAVTDLGVERSESIERRGSSEKKWEETDATERRARVRIGRPSENGRVRRSTPRRPARRAARLCPSRKALTHDRAMFRNRRSVSGRTTFPTSPTSPTSRTHGRRGSLRRRGVDAERRE